MVVCMAGMCDLVVESSYWIYWIGPFVASFVVAEYTYWLKDFGESQGEADGVDQDETFEVDQDKTFEVDAEDAPENEPEPKRTE